MVGGMGDCGDSVLVQHRILYSVWFWQHFSTIRLHHRETSGDLTTAFGYIATQFLHFCIRYLLSNFVYSCKYKGKDYATLYVTEDGVSGMILHIVETT